MAYQDGNSSFEAAEPVSQSFCVLPEKPTVQVEGEASAGVGVELVSSSPHGNQWYRNGESIEGATAQRYEVSGTRHFSVQVIIGECAGARSEDLVITALSGVVFASALKVYPNPVADKVQVEFASGKAMEEVQVVLVNAAGIQISLASKVIQLPYSEVVELDMSGLAAGEYFVLIRDGEAFIQAKVLKK